MTSRPVLDPLVHEDTVAASKDAVWVALTTKDGQESWMVAHSEIDLKVGGLMRTHYDPSGAIGDSQTIENEILCYDPGRMLSFRVTSPPADFHFLDAIKEMWTVIYLEATGPDTTLVRIVGLGIGANEESEKMRAFFDRGNAWTLQKLRERFATDPES